MTRAAVLPAPGSARPSCSHVPGAKRSWSHSPSLSMATDQTSIISLGSPEALHPQPRSRPGRALGKVCSPLGTARCVSCSDAELSGCLCSAWLPVFTSNLPRACLWAARSDFLVLHKPQLGRAHPAAGSPKAPRFPQAQDKTVAKLNPGDQIAGISPQRLTQPPHCHGHLAASCARAGPQAGHLCPSCSAAFGYTDLVKPQGRWVTTDAHMLTQSPARCRSWVLEQHLGTPECFPSAGASARPDLGPKISFAPTEALGTFCPWAAPAFIFSPCFSLWTVSTCLPRHVVTESVCVRREGQCLFLHVCRHNRFTCQCGSWVLVQCKPAVRAGSELIYPKLTSTCRTYVLLGFFCHHAAFEASPHLLS